MGCTHNTWFEDAPIGTSKKLMEVCENSYYCHVFTIRPVSPLTFVNKFSGTMMNKTEAPSQVNVLLTIIGSKRSTSFKHTAAQLDT